MLTGDDAKVMFQFSVTATGPPLGFQWQSNGAPIPAAALATLNRAKADPSSACAEKSVVGNSVTAVTIKRSHK